MILCSASSSTIHSKFLLLSSSTVPSKYISNSPEASVLNAPLPISVTDFGIVIDVKLEQLLKADSPILVTPSGIVTDVRDAQP